MQVKNIKAPYNCLPCIKHSGSDVAGSLILLNANEQVIWAAEFSFRAYKKLQFSYSQVPLQAATAVKNVKADKRLL